jgi:hypothetical protein
MTVKHFEVISFESYEAMGRNEWDNMFETDDIGGAEEYASTFNEDERAYHQRIDFDAFTTEKNGLIYRFVRK